MEESPLVIRDVEDLERILLTHPAWRERLRQLLLGEGLTALPQRFERFVAEEHAQLDQTLRRIGQLVEKLAEENLRLAQQTTLLTHRLNDLTQHMGRVEAQIEALTQRMERVEAQIEALTQRVNDLTQRMEQVDAQIEALTQRVNDLTQRMERVEAQIEALTQRVNDLTQRMEQVEAQISQLAERVADLTRRMEQAESQIEALAHQLKRNTDELAELKGIVLELRLPRKAIVLFRQEFSAIRVLSEESWGALLDEAEEKGYLTAPEISDLSQVDGVIEAIRRSDTQPVVLAVEVSAVGDRVDVERAARRAVLLQRLYTRHRGSGVVGIGSVAARQFTQGARKLASARGVLLKTFPIKLR